MKVEIHRHPVIFRKINASLYRVRYKRSWENYSMDKT